MEPDTKWQMNPERVRVVSHDAIVLDKSVSFLPLECTHLAGVTQETFSS